MRTLSAVAAAALVLAAFGLALYVWLRVAFVALDDRRWVVGWLALATPALVAMAALACR